MPYASRLPADLQRDASSKPAQVIAFLGIAPGMSVLDLHAGDGYYSEWLSRAVGGQGRVIAHNHPGALDGLQPHTFEQRYGNERLANVEQLFARHDELDLPPETLDAVLMSMVYHDTYWFDPDIDWGPVDHRTLLAELFNALKPGGVIGIVDHCAAAGSDPHVSAVQTHRIDPVVVRRDFEQAGFVLDAESDLFRNCEDDHALDVFHPVVQGKTDRFLMRFTARASER